MGIVRTSWHFPYRATHGWSATLLAWIRDAVSGRSWRADPRQSATLCDTRTQMLCPETLHPAEIHDPASDAATLAIGTRIAFAMTPHLVSQDPQP